MYDIALHGMGVGAASLHPTLSGEGHAIRWAAAHLGGQSEIVGVDVGANVGHYAETWSETMPGPAWQLHCFEPGKETFERLQARYAHEKRIRCVNSAVGAVVGETTLYSDINESSVASTLPDAFSVSGFEIRMRQEVRLTTLDEYCRQNVLERVHILKVDVEGAELDVLRGAADLLGRSAIDFVLFELGHRTIAARTYLWDFYQTLPGYTFYRVTPKAIVPLGEYRAKHEIFWNATNYLAVSPMVKKQGSPRP
jgi:FkbM family methyltransferase